jgi:translation initiation factor IF-2
VFNIIVILELQSKARQIADRRERVAELKRMRAQALLPQPMAAMTVISPSGSATTSADGTVLSHAEAAAAAAAAMGADGSVAAAAEGIGSAPPVPAGPVTVSVLIKADGVGTLEALQKIVQGLASRTKDVILQVRLGWMVLFFFHDLLRSITIISSSS